MKQFTCPLALCLSLSLLGGAPAGAAAADLFAGSAWALLRPAGAADLKTVSAPGGKILHVTVRRPVTAYYQIQLTHDIAAAVPAGATLRYEFSARSTTKNPIHAVIEKRTAPYTHLLDKPITLTPAWKKYAFSARVPTAYAKNGLAARLQLGQKKGEIEFKGLTLTAGR
jgi:hypothetical protein